MKKAFVLISFMMFCQAVVAQSSGAKSAISGPAHEKYMGKIVFTGDDVNIARGKENEAGFKNEFNLGDPIYFRVYMQDALLNFLRPYVKGVDDYMFTRDSRFILKVYLDGKYLDSLYKAKLKFDEFAEAEKKTWTTFRGALKSTDNSVYIGTYMYKEFLTKYERLLTPGSHKLTIEVCPEFAPFDPRYKAYLGDVVARGEITLNVKGSAIDPNDPNTCMPLSKMDDKELTKQIRETYTKLYGVKALSARILTPQWTIERSKYTELIKRRSLEVSIGYNQGGKCYRRAYMLYQEYDGRNFMKDLTFETNMQNPPYEINCKCLPTE